MSLLVPYAGFSSIIVSWSFRSGQEGFDIYKYEYICFPCAFSLVLIFEFGPLFFFWFFFFFFNLLSYDIGARTGMALFI